MSVLFTIGVGWFLCSLVMLGLYFIQLWKRDATIVDVGWSLLIGLLSIFYAYSLPINNVQQWAVLMIAVIWSFRLTYYLWSNRVKGNKPEDGRYQTIRNNWGEKAQLFFIAFFQAQALIALLFSIPIFIALQNTNSDFTMVTMMGILIAVISILGESVADFQLANFRSKPENKGMTCQTGLWKYSRHPNYFFEWLHWFAYVFFAYSSPYWWITIAGPILMLLFIFRLTGIPYTEKQAVTSRGESYKKYQHTTSVFIPWFPKKEKT